MKQPRDGSHGADPGIVCYLHQVLEVIPAWLAQLSSATSSTGEKKSPQKQMCVYILVWGQTTAQQSQWAAHPWAVCISVKAQGAQGQRTFSPCVYERCVALHQLAYVYSYRAILGESKHAFKVFVHLHSKKSLHYCSSYQRPGNISTEQPLNRSPLT